MYRSGILSDHRAFFIVIDVNHIERGAGYWKFNNLLLHDITFLQQMNTEIMKTTESLEQKDPITSWEILKNSIKKFTCKYSRTKGSEEKLIIAQLTEVISGLEEQLPLNRQDTVLLENTKTDLEEKLEERVNGIIFRSKARWYEKGERSTKYFYALEKSRYNAKTCYVLKDENEQLIQDPQRILQMQKEFYSKLYEKDEDVSFTLKNSSSIRVPQNIKEEQCQPLKLQDLEEAIKTMRNNRTPGEDGLPIDFYKVFWKILKKPFYNMMNAVKQCGILHNTARSGILNLIPKPNKDTRLIKNLRPITLLNTDYKIIEKAIANKMIPALEHIIHSDQRGFMKERRISVNIRKLLDIIHYAKEQDLEALVLSLDFVKCFDKCSFSILHGSLDFFGFGATIKEWTEILYKDFSVKIQNNGNFSTRIKIKKGVHQGGCCSSIYFLVIAEILAIALRNNQKIEGITIEQIRNILNQFADDADVFSMNSKVSLDEIFSELEKFRKQSGFTISYDKTVLYRIGSLRHSNAMLYNIDQVAWSNEDINVLGVTIAHDNLTQKNYVNIQEKVKTILSSWEHRGLTLMGKVLVVNTLIASLFVYKMMVLPNMPKNTVKNVENEIRHFLWNGKTSKIAYEILKNPKDMGGLNLVDFKNKEISLKATWPCILNKEKDYATMVYSLISPTIKHLIWQVNLRPEDVHTLNIHNEFWVHVLESWCTFNYWNEFCLENQILWMNSRIRVDNKPFLWKNAYSEGLLYIHQLFSNGEMKTEQQLKEQYKLTTMQCNTIRACIPKEWKTFFSELSETVYLPTPPNNYQKLSNIKQVSRHIYKRINGDPSRGCSKIAKWNQEIGTTWGREEFDSLCKDIKIWSNYTKIKDFQYRLLQRALITNIQLQKWKIKESNMCTFCQKHPETVKHLLMECVESKDLWSKFAEYCHTTYNKQLDITYSDIISNHFTNPKRHIINTLGLFLKQYIYRNRCLDTRMSFENYNRYINKVKNIEKYIAIKNDKMSLYYAKWEPEKSMSNRFGNLQNFINEYVETLSVN